MNCPKVKLKHGSRVVISGVISETGVLRMGSYCACEQPAGQTAGLENNSWQMNADRR